MQSTVSPSEVSWISIPTVIVILTVILTIFRFISFLYFEKHKINLKKIEITESVLSANLHRASLKQRFLAEQVFSSIYRCDLSFDEINVLLRYSYPSYAFVLFSKGKTYLKLSKNMKSIEFKGNYWSISVFKWKVLPRQLLLFSLYLIWGIVGSYALSPIIIVYNEGSWLTVPRLTESINMVGWEWGLLSSAISLICWIFAFKSLASIDKIKAAFTLMGIDCKSLNR
jgi:hypothetical protein